MKKFRIAIMGIVFLLAPLAAQTVTMTYPNGGESLAPGSAGRITWTANRVSQNVKLILLNEDNSIYGVIARDLAPGSSPYPWAVGDTEVGRAPEGRYKVRVSTMDGGSKDVSDAAFAIAAGGSPEPPDASPVTVASPRAGETWLEGTSYDITWNAGGLSGTAAVRLCYGATSTGSFRHLQSVNLSDGRLRWEADNGLPPSDARDQDGSYFYRIGISQGSDGPVAYSGAFHIVRPSGHDLVISDPYLEQRSSGKGFRVKVTDLNSDFNGWVVISHYCMGMGLGNAVQERRRLELRQGVPARVNLANVRGSLFDNKCDVNFRFDVNPDHAVVESNYDNNIVQKKFCWQSGHDGRFFSLRLGRNYTATCEECAVIIRPADVESVDGGRVRIRLEITLQNCGMTAVRGGEVLINESWNGGRSTRCVHQVRGIDIEPGQYKLLNETVTLERHAGNGLHIDFNSGESGTLNANNQFTCHPNYIGF